MKFSVLLSVYKDDSPDHLNDAIASIWDLQSLRPGQVVIVKDGPLTPVIEDVLSHWHSALGEVLTIVEFPINRGLGAALHDGLEACRNELVARMDADDVAFPDRFETQVRFLQQNTDIDVVGSFVEEMTFGGTSLRIRRVPVDHDSIVANLWASPMIHPTVMMRRSKVVSAGNYDPVYRRRQDYELWFRCAEKGLRFYNLPQALLRYRFGVHTHQKQSAKLALEQAMIGFRGARRLDMPAYQQAACFIPFARSLLPGPLQHIIYKLLKPFDPRQKVR